MKVTTKYELETSHEALTLWSLALQLRELDREAPDYNDKKEDVWRHMRRTVNDMMTQAYTEGVGRGLR